MNPHLPSADPGRTAPGPTRPSTAAADGSTVPPSHADGTRPPTTAPPRDAPPVPGYRLTGEIARGGMGRVYAARHLALDREVAVKTLLAGADATRFVTESKITAELQHPNIPPVYDLGELADGTPFLAMKLIRGTTLADRLTARSSPRHDLPRLVQIFEQICQAVGFAHSRGVIHRDLKPANVMVGEFGEVQVMDWGLARGTATLEPPASAGRVDPPSPLTRAVPDHHTHAGAIMGTPAYMAPEQARGEPVDARADVFALGGILATVLTGQSAFVGTTAMDTVRKAANADLADVLSRLDGCGADADLVAVAKRCLAATADERPADGQAVAAEVGAYRAGVEARLRQAETERAEAVVREGEQRKRQRQFAVAAGVVAAALVLGLAGTGVGLLVAVDRADREERAKIAEGQAKEAAKAAEEQAKANAQQARDERDAKDVALKGQTQARELAETQRQEAETNLAFSKKGNKILGSVFEGLDPRRIAESGRPLQDVLRENLAKAVKELDGSAIGDPLAVAEMQNTLGLSLRALGESALAVEMFEKAHATRLARLGPDHPDTLTSLNNLAMGYQYAGQVGKALPLNEECYRLRKAELGADHPDTLTSLNNLAESHREAGQLELALPLLEECYRLRKRKLGADHPSTLTNLSNLAGGHRDAGQLEKALPLLEECYRLMKAKLPADHPDTLTSLGNLGAVYCSAKQGEKAAPLLKQFVTAKRKQLPKDDRQFAGLLAQVSHELLKCDDQFAVAEEMLREALAILEKKEPDVWSTFNTQSMLGGALAGQKKYADAEPLLVKGYEGMKEREKAIPKGGEIRIPEVLDRLVALYTVTEKSDEVKKYKELRAKYPEAKKEEKK